MKNFFLRGEKLIFRIVGVSSWVLFGGDDIDGPL